MDIVAATSISYVLTAADSGRNIRVRESLADARGARAATSAAVAIPGGGTVFSDDFSANTTASYSATGWEIVAGQARMIGLTGQVAVIIPVPDPALSADHFVRGTLGTLGTGTNVLRLRAKMALNWGSSFSNVSANVRADGRLIMQINGADVATHIVSGGFSVGDTIELRITGGGTLATILRNGVVPSAALQNVDVSTVAASSRVAFGLQGGWHLDRFEAGNI